MDYPEVSICIPVYERNEFLYLTLSNIKRQTYPHDKLTVIIDECKSNNPFITDISQVRQYLHPIKLIHKVYNSRSGIGEKRNRLVKTATTKYIQFFDTDDFYLPNYVSTSVFTLIYNNKKACGSANMILTNGKQYFKQRCVNLHLINEGTLIMNREWYLSSGLYLNQSHSEASYLLLKNIKKVLQYLKLCIMWVVSK